MDLAAEVAAKVQSRLRTKLDRLHETPASDIIGATPVAGVQHADASPACQQTVCEMTQATQQVVHPSQEDKAADDTQDGFGCSVSLRHGVASRPASQTTLAANNEPSSPLLAAREQDGAIQAGKRVRHADGDAEAPPALGKASDADENCAGNGHLATEGADEEPQHKKRAVCAIDVSGDEGETEGETKDAGPTGSGVDDLEMDAEETPQAVGSAAAATEGAGGSLSNLARKLQVMREQDADVVLN